MYCREGCQYFGCVADSFVAQNVQCCWGDCQEVFRHSEGMIHHVMDIHAPGDADWPCQGIFRTD